MPLPMPREVEINLYHNIGAIIIRWGVLDALLATSCQILFENLKGHPSHKEPPRALSKRLEFMKKCFNNKPELAFAAQSVSDLCIAIEEIGKHRDYFVHGCLTDYFPEPTAYQFTKMDMKPDKTGYDQWSTKLSKTDLLNIAKSSEQVCVRLGEIGRTLRKLSASK